MTGFDTFTLSLSALAFLLYGAICIISIFFTFFLDVYRRMEERLGFNIIPYAGLTPLEVNIFSFNTWLVEHNKIIGPFLILLSILDLKLLFDIIFKCLYILRMHSE